jgi:hypothetical protein
MEALLLTDATTSLVQADENNEPSRIAMTERIVSEAVHVCKT